MYPRSLRRVKSIGMRVAQRTAVTRGLVRKLTLWGGLLLASPGFACRYAYCAQRLAPADGLTLPANAQVAVAKGQTKERYDPETDSVVVWRPWIRRSDADGGVQLLEAAPLSVQPQEEFRDATLFALGPLQPGDRIRLESSPDCSGPQEPSSEIRIVDAAPLPTRLGVPFSPITKRVEPKNGLDCNPLEFSKPSVTRELYLEIDESVAPWLAIARVNLRINGRLSNTDYGRLARSQDGGSVVFVDRFTRLCVTPGDGSPSTTVETWPVRLELEVPGAQRQPPPVDFTVEMDCRPSCAAAGGVPWMLGLLLYRRRRARPRLRSDRTEGLSERSR
jgi:hypothetical protein